MLQVNFGKSLRLVLLPPILVLLSACASIGAGSVNRDRLDYAEALATSWKEQMLLNIVKLRYADTPMFLDVSSVISSYQLQSQVSLLGTVSTGLTPNLRVLPASLLDYKKPTVEPNPIQPVA